MARLTVEGLKKLRTQKRRELENRDTKSATIQVIVGMGTSGIAAGARATLDALVEELKQHDLTDVKVRQTGSLGLDHAEPTVEILMEDMPDVIYGKVTAEIARKLVRKHIIGKSLINDHVYDRPAVDLLAGSEED